MKSVIIMMLLLISFAAKGQTSVEEVLSSVKENNREITALKKEQVWKLSELKPPSVLHDPVIEYDYLFSSDAAMGNQRDFSVSQPFDLPAVYKRKTGLYRQQEIGLRSALDHAIQTTLLDAKLLLLDKIYLTRKTSALEAHLEDAESLVTTFEKKMKHGEATIVDLNRAKIHVLKLRKDLALCKMDSGNIQLQLNQLNGGHTIQFTDSIYPAVPPLLTVRQLDSIVEMHDLELRGHENDIAIAREQVKLQQALRLPAIEAGYHSQSILNQSYRGVHLSLTLPLFQGRKQIVAAQRKLDYQVFERDRHLFNHQLAIQQLHDSIQYFRQIMNEVEEHKSSSQIEPLLRKALLLGELSLTDYIKEKEASYEVTEEYLKAELMYNKLMARAFRFQLQ